MNRSMLVIAVLVVATLEASAPVAGLAAEPRTPERVSLGDSNKWLDAAVDNPADLAYLDHYSWPYKIRHICEANRIPCGIEESAKDPISPLREGTEVMGLDYGHRRYTTRQVLDLIVARHPSYRWQIDGGVLNIVPLDGSRLSNQIKDLQIRADINEAFGKVCKAAGAPLNGATIHPVDVLARKRLIIHLRHKTVREAFNSIVLSQGQAAWVVLFDPTQKAYSVTLGTWVWGSRSYF